MDKKDVRVKDRVQTVKGVGIVVWADDKTVLVDLDGGHGTYCFHKNSVWKLVEDNKEQ
jgi:hypothetical protein